VEKGLVGKGVGSGDLESEKKERKKGGVVYTLYLYTEPTKVGRRGMKRGDFPSAVYVAFLLPVSRAAVSPPPSPKGIVESSLNYARRVLITNNYEC